MLDSTVYTQAYTPTIFKVQISYVLIIVSSYINMASFQKFA